MMLVAAYMRYSSENQRDGYSIEAQTRAIDEYCERVGWTIVHRYIDEARSGTSDDREDFQNMIADAATGSFEGVVVHKFDRFSRDKYDNVIYKRELRNYGVKVYSVLEPLDDSPESVILEALLEAMAEYYSKNLAREVKKGFRVKASKGQWCGGVPPYGYAVDKETSMLKIVPSEAEIVKLVFNQYNNGTPLLQVENNLRAMGVKTRDGFDFTAPSLRNILRNEKYNGTFIYGKTKKVKGRIGKKNAPQKASEMIVLEGVVPTIIENNLWISVQNRLNSNTYNTTRAKVNYMLSGLIFCGCCGSPFVGGGSVPRYDKEGNEIARYNFYTCSRKRRTHDCNGSQVSKERIEHSVVKAIVDYCYNEESIGKFTEDFQRWYENNANENAKEISLYKEELTKLEKQKARVISLALDGVLNAKEAKEQKDAIEMKIATIEPKLRALEKQAVPNKKELARFMEETRQALLDGSFDDYETLIRQHVAKIEVFKGYQLITLKKVPYLTEPHEEERALTHAKKISDSANDVFTHFSVSLTKKFLPNELLLTVRVEKKGGFMSLVA